MADNESMRAPLYQLIASCALTGLDGVPVEIELSILPGLPRFEITGRGDPAIRESRERVRAAITNSGFNFPRGRVIASYAPAALPKQGSAFDLPLAIAVLAASTQVIRPEGYPPAAFLGELSLDGRVKPVNGILGRVLALRDAGLRHVVGPREGEQEADLVDSVDYAGVSHLKEAVRCFAGIRKAGGRTRPVGRGRVPSATPGLPVQVAGQEEGARACLIAAAGWHPLLMMGAPGCGKTLLASAIPGWLPPLDSGEALEVLRVQSVAGSGGKAGEIAYGRPFRRAHHSLTVSALIGGGSIPVPGECTLAHRGVLFLDEITEMNARVLDALREPVESGKIRLARTDWKVIFPADFLLVAACNPCRCGLLLEPGSHCRCQDNSIRRHLSRISGPLFDRFDLVAALTRVEASVLLEREDPASTSGKSYQPCDRVQAAWDMQKSRAAPAGPGTFHNSRVKVTDPGRAFHIGEDAMRFAAGLADASLLTARSFYSMLRVARTIADLAQRGTVRKEDIAEAFHYKAAMPRPPGEKQQ